MDINGFVMNYFISMTNALISIQNRLYYYFISILTSSLLD